VLRDGRASGRLSALAVIATLFWVAGLPAQNADRIPRTPDGRPDLQGFWANGTITPLLRPPEFADREFLTPQEAAEFERTALPRLLQGAQVDGRVPEELTYTYMDRLAVVDGGRTSLIVDPPSGRFPPRAPQFTGRDAVSSDDPETRTPDERCLVGAAAGSSSAAPPMVPNPISGNFYQIVQTRDHVMILAELIHDARVIRLNGRHGPPAVRSWLGDSIGRWEGDSLVVDTVNFHDRRQWRGSSGRGMRVVERFTRTDATTIRYRATVEDPERWIAPWSMELPFKATTQAVFEYACHEGNHSLGAILRGARVEDGAR
jgi:hypothetical protein